MPQKKTEYHHGDLRQALLQAAERLVAEEGEAQASLRAIAREAGVSAAAPYHHFEDREALLAGVAASGFRRLEEAMAGAAGTAGDGGGLDRLQAAGVAYVRFAVENPMIYRLMFSGLLSDRSRYPELREAADGAFAVLQRLLVGDGGSDRDGPLPTVALATWSTVHGLAFLLIEGLLRGGPETADPEDVTRAVTEVLGRGLKSYAAGGS